MKSAHLYIIGAGAIGKALAVFLKHDGKNVTLIRGTLKDGFRKTESLHVEMDDGAIYRADVEIATLNTFSTLSGIIILANKSFGNEQLAVSLKAKTGNSPIVLLQNGLGVEQPFIHHRYPEIYRCVLFVTSHAVSLFAVRFKPVATCPVGIERGNRASLDHIVSQLNTQVFGFKSELNIQQIIWKKAIVNCVFNSVCPLLEVDNGIFQRNPDARKIARRVISECTAIARAKGIDLHADEVETSLIQISRLSDGQDISTLQDIRNNRQTEIETLNPEMVRIAESLGKGDLVPETRLLGELTRLKADNSMLTFERTKTTR